MQIQSVSAAIVATQQSPAVTAVQAQGSVAPLSAQTQPIREDQRATGFVSGQTPLSQEAVSVLQANAANAPQNTANDPTALANANALPPLFAPPPPSAPEQTEEAAPAQDEAEDAAAQDEEGSDGLTPQEEEEVADLKRRDAEVRRHEQAHAAVGGQYAGSPRYQYETGPDGVQYVVDGEVSIAASPIPGDPEATIEKAKQVRRAALAPESPSAQDQQVAALAQQQINQARAELARQEREDPLASVGNEQGQAPDPTARPDPTATEDDRASRSLFAAQAFQQSQQLGSLQRPSQISG
jgi:hypothetical protein